MLTPCLCTDMSTLQGMLHLVDATMVSQELGTRSSLLCVSRSRHTTRPGAAGLSFQSWATTCSAIRVGRIIVSCFDTEILQYWPDKDPSLRRLCFISQNQTTPVWCRTNVWFQIACWYSVSKRGLTFAALVRLAALSITLHMKVSQTGALWIHGHLWPKKEGEIRLVICFVN